jgi:hypothetical protein
MPVTPLARGFCLCPQSVALVDAGTYAYRNELCFALGILLWSCGSFVTC